VIRATVVIRQRDADSDDGYASEWVHKQDLEFSEYGVWLEWPRDRASILVPWASVVRIDCTPCCCTDCQVSKAA
jgi:hypothetical protein